MTTTLKRTPEGKIDLASWMREKHAKEDAEREIEEQQHRQPYACLLCGTPAPRWSVRNPETPLCYSCTSVGWYGSRFAIPFSGDTAADRVIDDLTGIVGLLCKEPVARSAKNLADRLDLDEIIKGLVGDLKSFRAGEISHRDARVRAELAREILRGVRLIVEAQKFMAGRALPVPTDG